MLTERQLRTFATGRNVIVVLMFGIFGMIGIFGMLLACACPCGYPFRIEPVVASVCAWGISLAALGIYVMTSVQAFRSRSWVCGLATVAFLGSPWFGVWMYRYFWEVSILRSFMDRFFWAPITIPLIFLVLVLFSYRYVLWKNRKSGVLAVSDSRPTLDEGRLRRFVRTYHLMVLCLIGLLCGLVSGLGLRIGGNIWPDFEWFGTWCSGFMFSFAMCAFFVLLLSLFALLVRGRSWSPVLKNVAILVACILLGNMSYIIPYDFYFPESGVNWMFFEEEWFQRVAQILLLSLIPVTFRNVFECHAMRFHFWISRENLANAALLEAPVFPVQSPEWLRGFLKDYRAFLVCFGVSLVFLWALCLYSILNEEINILHDVLMALYIIAIFLSDVFALRLALKPGVPRRCRVLAGVFVVGSLVPALNFVLIFWVFWFLELFCYDVFRAHGIKPSLWILLR